MTRIVLKITFESGEFPDTLIGKTKMSKLAADEITELFTMTDLREDFDYLSIVREE